MANFDEIARRADVAVTAFGGLNRSGPLCGGKDCFELLNLRPMADGTLSRREGYRPLWSFDEPIRDVIALERDGKCEVYMIVGTTMYASDGVCEPFAIGDIPAGGAAHLVCVDGNALLLTGREIMLLSLDGVRPVLPYVPLYGKDWSPLLNGERAIWERPNLLTNRIRVSIRMPSSEIYIHLSDLNPLSVDAVLIGGSEKAVEGWTYDARRGYCMLNQTCPDGERVDLVMTMPDSFFGQRSDPRVAVRTAVVGNAEDRRLLMFGGTLLPGQAYMTRAVDEAERAIVRAIDPESCPMLYVTEEDKITIGDGVQPITGACCHYDRSLIFMPRGVWMMDNEVHDDGSLRMIPVNATLGCTADGGCAVVGNSPYTIFGRRVLRWNDRTDERDECNAEVLSGKVEMLFDEAFGHDGRVVSHPWRREVYFYCPGHDSRVFVFSEESGVWTSFDGFSPEGMLLLGERLVFFSGRTLYLFDEGATTDVHEDGSEHPIRARYEGQYLDFGHAGRQRRIYGVSVTAECEEARLTLHDARGRTVERMLRGADGNLSVMQIRGRGGRFRFVRAGIECTDTSRFRLHGIRLTVGP